VTTQNQMNSNPYRVLSLDGGGAKGFYTVGVLKELEALTGKRVHETFDLVYGTSTGAIIASLLAMGRTVDEVHQLYRENVPAVMKARGKRGKSAALERLATDIYDDTTFEQLKTGIGIVSAKHLDEIPIVFKDDARRAQSRVGTFVPGFGVLLKDAVVASCSAYPFFTVKQVKTSGSELIDLLDGGYCANNPTLFAIVDALKMAPSDAIRVVNIGVGHYPEPSRYGFEWAAGRFFLSRLLQKTLNLNANSMEQLRGYLLPQVKTVRISNTYSEPHMATDMFEHDLKKLSVLHQKGRASFAAHEATLKQYLIGDPG